MIRIRARTPPRAGPSKAISASVPNAVPSVNLYRANILRHLRSPVAWRTSVPVQLVVALRDPWVTPRAVTGMPARPGLAELPDILAGVGVGLFSAAGLLISLRVAT